MPRTNAKSVRELLAGNYDTETCPSLERFIRAAGFVVDRMVTCAAAKGYTFSTAELAEIEATVAAHRYMTATPGFLTSESYGKASQSYQRVGESSYMADAVALDPSGCLSGLLNPAKRAGGFWLGKAPSEQTPYDQRD